eukprot:gene21371-biopygen7322
MSGDGLGLASWDAKLAHPSPPLVTGACKESPGYVMHILGKLIEIPSTDEGGLTREYRSENKFSPRARTVRNKIFPMSK